MNVPDIGGDEVNVTEIMVAVGDSVSEEQSLITVEGDKASMEVPAPFAGVVKEILVKSGDKVSTGSLIMKFEVAGASTRSCSSLQQRQLQNLKQHLQQRRQHNQVMYLV